MRAPIRSETDAFRFTLAAVLVIGATVLIGWLTAPLVGVVVLVVACVAAALAYLYVGGRDRRQVLREAATAPHAHGAQPGTRHVLIIANETLGGDELARRIRDGDGKRVEVDVLAPVLTSRLHLGVTDIDHELAAADTRLRRSLAWARTQGITARGAVGRDGPVTAIADELRDFGADEVIVVTHPQPDETWQERGEIERLRHELDVPVAHIVVGGALDQQHAV